MKHLDSNNNTYIFGIMKTELTQSKLIDRFKFESGTFEIPIRLYTGKTILAYLNDSLSICGVKICPIDFAEDLEAFLTAIKAEIVVDGEVIAIDQISEGLTEAHFVREIVNIMEIVPETLRTNTKWRDRNYTLARQLHMMVRHQALDMSFAQAAKIYDKDHATAMHGIKTVNNIRDTEPEFRAKTEKLFKMIESCQK